MTAMQSCVSIAQMLMRYAVHLLPVILPVLFWAGYHYYKDRHLPEPVSHLALAFILGRRFVLSRNVYVPGAGLRESAL